MTSTGASARVLWRKRARWAWAGALGRLPGTCWPGLVSWAIATREEQRSKRQRHPLREAVGVSICQRDAAATGACYCGKFRREGDA